MSDLGSTDTLDDFCSDEQTGFLFVQMNKHFKIQIMKNRYEKKI
jgi:hypothetical protein